MQQTGAMHVAPDLWPDEQGRLLILVKNQEEGFTVYDDQGNRQWSGPGWPAPGDARYLLARQARETWLMDRQGNVVAKYPRDTYFTQDGKALIRKAGHRFLIYRRPL